jgi:4-amino-4-deoxy-L-arabinose transferase-like glycosyltransferase
MMENRSRIRGVVREGSGTGRYISGSGSDENFTGILHPLREAGPVHILILLSILLAGSYLRFSDLPDAGIGTDEAEKFFAVEDYREGKFWVDLEHPPLEKYLILLSTGILGNDDWTVKLPNVILGAFTPFILFLVGVRLGKDPWVGHASAAMGALSPMLIGYSLVAKEDVLVNLLSLLALLFLSVSLEADKGSDIRDPRDHEDTGMDLRSLKRRMNPKNLDGYAITGAFLSGLALASKYTFVFFTLSWLIVIFMMNRSWLKRKGPAFFLIMMVVFIILAWYYLNPYWLILGIGHWLWESATGHSTYFLGETYTYPPFWFYPITFIGRVAPLITMAGFMVAVSSLFELPWKRSVGDQSTKVIERMGRHFRTDPLKYMLISWVIICFLMMTLLPFKGIRYIQWIILPLIILAALGIRKISRILPEKWSGKTSLAVVIILMIPALSHADPHYREVTYFIGSDSGMKDLDGQGFREAFEFMEENGLNGRVAVRWEKLASYYWDNVTGPVNDHTQALEEDIGFLLIYRADVNRGLESGFTGFARSQTEIFSHSHGGYDLIWLYRLDREEAPI